MLEFQRLVVGACFSNGNLKVYSEMVSINDNVQKLLCCVFVMTVDRLGAFFIQIICLELKVGADFWCVLCKCVRFEGEEGRKL